MPTGDRSDLQWARLDAGRWGKRGGWGITFGSAWVPGVMGAAVAPTKSPVINVALGVALGFFLFYVGVLAYYYWKAPRHSRDAALKKLADRDKRIRDLEERAPKLSLGRVVISEYSLDPLGDIPNQSLPGKVLQVPVIVSRGTEDARAVQARLNFQPEEANGLWSPTNSISAEWEVEDESLPIRVDIPSNGQPMHFNVAFVADAGHPAVYVWTKESRELGMGPRTFGIAMGRVQIHVEVSGAGHGAAAPHVEDTLHIELYNGMINTHWENAGLPASAPRSE